MVTHPTTSGYLPIETDQTSSVFRERFKTLRVSVQLNLIHIKNFREFWKTTWVHSVFYLTPANSNNRNVHHSCFSLNYFLNYIFLFLSSKYYELSTFLHNFKGFNFDYGGLIIQNYPNKVGHDVSIRVQC